MLRALLAGMLAVTLAAMPAAAQTLLEPPAAQVNAALIGLPIFSSDGEELGRATEVGMYDGEAILIAEIERLLGIGSTLVAIPAHMIELRADRIRLTITASQVRDTLAGPRH